MDTKERLEMVAGTAMRLMTEKQVHWPSLLEATEHWATAHDRLRNGLRLAADRHLDAAVEKLHAARIAA